MCDDRQYTDATIAELHAIRDTPATAYERGRQEALNTVLTRLQSVKDAHKMSGDGGIFLAGLIVAICIVQDVAQAECDNPPDVTE